MAETKKFLDFTGLTRYDENLKSFVSNITGDKSNLTTTNKTNLVSAVNEVNSIAKGATVALVANNYSALVTSFSGLGKDVYKIGQSVYIKTLEVPDVWVSEISNESSTYTYTTDAQVIDDLNAGTFKVGYYTFSKLETQKVDLTDYATSTDLSNLESDINEELDKKMDKELEETISSAIVDLENKIENVETEITKKVSTEYIQEFSDLEKEVARTNINAYSKPDNGIPEKDLEQRIQNILDSAVKISDISVDGDANGHDYVEIGGLKWATKNIGAQNITDAGQYFQWGDTQGWTADEIENGDKTFDWSSYKYTNNDDWDGCSKYQWPDDQTDAAWYEDGEFIGDNKKVLEPGDDAVTSAWGGDWRMPTKEEFIQLQNSVNTEWVTDYQDSGVNGLLVTDKNDNTKTLFFPASGNVETDSINYVGDNGYYWSSSCDLEYVDCPVCAHFEDGAETWNSGDCSRNYGLPIRGILGSKLGKTATDEEKARWNNALSTEDGEVLAGALADLSQRMDDSEEVVSAALNDLATDITDLDQKIEDNELVTASALADLNQRTDENELVTAAAMSDLDNRVTEVYEKDSKVLATAINEISKKVIDTSWKNLYTLKHLERLTPGMWYRITDYSPTNIENTILPEDAKFDILVLATGIGSLSESAQAIRKDPMPSLKFYKTDCGYFDEVDEENYFIYVDEYEFDGDTYYRWQKYESGDETEWYILTNSLYGPGDLSLSNPVFDYIQLQNDSEYDFWHSLNVGLVDCRIVDGERILYKTSFGYYDEVDYNEYFVLVGTLEFDGETYYRWEKYENDEPTDAGYGALTPELYMPGDATLSNPKPMIAINGDGEEYNSDNGKTMVVLVETNDEGKPEEETTNISYESWQLGYCIDNDSSRFPWADSEKGKGVIYRIIDENNIKLINLNNGLTVEIEGKKKKLLLDEKPEYTYVDMGLPSDLLWAAQNVGAETDTEPGLYFTWGSVEGFTKDSGRYCDGSYNGERNWSGPYSKEHGSELGDSQNIPVNEYFDAARKNMGASWRIPTKAEMVELHNSTYTTWTWTQRNGMNGYLIVSKVNGNSIFLPAAGYFGSEFYYLGSDGLYWESDFYDEKYGCVLLFDSGSVDPENGDYRYYGYSVRAVRDNFVDLGLPSGTKWAKKNLGASNPEDSGLYFSWGNIDGHANGSGYSFSDSNYNGTPGKTLTTDIPVNATYDAARANKGSIWRIPTKEEFVELNNYTWSTWYSDWKETGVAGREFVSKINGESIFIPAAGYFLGSSSRNNFGTYGCYWSSTRSGSTVACGLYFDSSSVGPGINNNRYCGFPVRPVQ